MWNVICFRMQRIFLKNGGEKVSNPIPANRYLTRINTNTFFCRNIVNVTVIPDGKIGLVEIYRWSIYRSRDASLQK